MILDLIPSNVLCYSDVVNAWSMQIVVIDTSAHISWVGASEASFRKRFPEAKLTNLRAEINGTDNDVESVCEVWVIPKFRIGWLIIENLYVALNTNKSVPNVFVLSSHVFSKTPFSVDYEKNQLRIDNRGAKSIVCNHIAKKDDSSVIDKWSVSLY